MTSSLMPVGSDDWHRLNTSSMSVVIGMFFSANVHLAFFLQHTVDTVAVTVYIRPATSDAKRKYAATEEDVGLDISLAAGIVSGTDASHARCRNGSG